MTNCPTCGTPANGGSHCESCGSVLATEERSELRSGHVVGRYVIGGVLGQGGFGITYIATDPSLNLIVALKELFPEGCIRTGNTVTGRATFGEMRLQFLREAHAMATLPKHPGLAQIYELIETNGTAYLALEFIDGTTAGKIVNEHPSGLAESRVLPWILQLARALDVVHSAGLIHRDVKPDNIIITGAGTDERAVLVDFGSAREFANSSTSAMTSLVTRGYAPLEQYGRTQRFGPTVDVYALGATAYHLLSGFAPPEAPDRASGDTLTALKESATTNRAIAQALSMTVAGRTQTMTQFIQQLTPETLGATLAPEPDKQPPQPRQEASAAGVVGPSSAAGNSGPGPIGANGSKHSVPVKPFVYLMIVLVLLLVVAFATSKASRNNAADRAADTTGAAEVVDPPAEETPARETPPARAETDIVPTTVLIPVVTAGVPETRAAQVTTLPPASFDLPNLTPRFAVNFDKSTFGEGIIDPVVYGGTSLSASGIASAASKDEGQFRRPIQVDRGGQLDDVTRKEFRYAIDAFDGGAHVLGVRLAKLSGREGILVAMSFTNGEPNTICNLQIETTLADSSTKNKLAIFKDHVFYFPQSEVRIPAESTLITVIWLPRSLLTYLPKTLDGWETLGISSKFFEC